MGFALLARKSNSFLNTFLLNELQCLLKSERNKIPIHFSLPIYPEGFRKRNANENKKLALRIW